MGLKELIIYVQRPAGYKRAYAYGPEDTVQQVMKDMKDTKFVPTVNELVLSMPDGTVMQAGKPLGDYGVKKGDCLASSI